MPYQCTCPTHTLVTSLHLALHLLLYRQHSKVLPAVQYVKSRRVIISATIQLITMPELLGTCTVYSWPMVPYQADLVCDWGVRITDMHLVCKHGREQQHNTLPIIPVLRHSHMQASSCHTHVHPRLSNVMMTATSPCQTQAHLAQISYSIAHWWLKPHVNNTKSLGHS